VILFLEAISKNIDMYVPAYSLSIMEVASFVRSRLPETDIQTLSIPMDYGLPLTREGKERVYRDLVQDISRLDPQAIGISCTAISQAEESITLCELIREALPGVFLFMGGYFPSLYFEDILLRTRAVDLLVIGEGEMPALEIIRALERGEDPRGLNIPGLARREGDDIRFTGLAPRFDLERKAPLAPGLLKDPGAYDILPYAFSRGCPYRCGFCMEGAVRPVRRPVPAEIVEKDLQTLLEQCRASTLLVSDALFQSFDMFPIFRSLNLKVHFETRCDTLDPAVLSKIGGVCGALAMGFESASYSTLRRMNKVRDRDHHRRYLANALAIFREAARQGIPLMVFMIAGYPGDTEEDLQESLQFCTELAQHGGPGGHVFKIGECRVYPGTPLHDLALSMPDVVFEDRGVFEDNVVTRPSAHLDFDTVLAYAEKIFRLSQYTEKLHSTILKLMPFFRLPARALKDPLVPKGCFRDESRGILDVRAESLARFRDIQPALARKYREGMSGQRSTRELSI
jgi:radical SAM superfamily enzyme YgiQ (UPF0313 family)